MKSIRYEQTETAEQNEIDREINRSEQIKIDRCLPTVNVSIYQ